MLRPSVALYARCMPIDYADLPASNPDPNVDLGPSGDSNGVGPTEIGAHRTARAQLKRYIGPLPEGLATDLTERLEATGGAYVLTHAQSPRRWKVSTSRLAASTWLQYTSGDATAMLNSITAAIAGDRAGVLYVAPTLSAVNEYVCTTRPTIPAGVNIVVQPGATLRFDAGVDFAGDATVQLMPGAAIKLGGPGLRILGDRVALLGLARMGRNGQSGRIVRSDATAADLITVLGTVSGTHLADVTISGLALDNADRNGALVRLQGADLALLSELVFDNARGAAVLLQDVIDVDIMRSYFGDVGTSGAALSSVRAAVHLDGSAGKCVNVGIVGNVSNGVPDMFCSAVSGVSSRHRSLHIERNRVETHAVRNVPPVAYIENVDDVAIDRMSATVGNFASGFTTAQNTIKLKGCRGVRAGLAVDGVDGARSIRTALSLEDCDGVSFDIWSTFNQTNWPTVSLHEYVGNNYNVVEGVVSVNDTTNGLRSSTVERTGAPKSLATPPIATPTVVLVSTTATLNVGANDLFDVTLGGNANISLSGWPAGIGTAVTVVVHQDTVGSRTLTWNGTIKWAGGVVPAVSSSGSSVDIYTFFSPDGTTVIGMQTLANAR